MTAFSETPLAPEPPAFDITPKASATPAPSPAPAPTASPEGPSFGTRSKVVAEPLHEIPKEVDSLLVTILSWPRQHASLQELQFCKFLREHIKQLGADVSILADGCIAATVKRQVDAATGKVGKGLGLSTTLFSCHVDTVEGTMQHAAVVEVDGSVNVHRKKLNYDPTFGLIGLEKDSIGGSLGSDDGAGVWLMLKMIERKVPGTYLFHRGEEVGGLGSAAMRDKYPEMLKSFECAVAFDRHDTFEVIRKQGGQTCASLKFTEALCKRLNDKGMRYEESDRGVFTDTKNYRKLIPECVNVAVGYQSQHGRNETLDYAHLAALLEACCAIDWDSLPIDRDPAEPDYPSYSPGRWAGHDESTSYQSWLKRTSGGQDPDNADLFHGFPRSDGLDKYAPGGKKQQQAGKKGKKQQAPALTKPVQPSLCVSEDLRKCSYEELVEWAYDYPDEAAKAIGHLLMEVAQAKAQIESAMLLLGWKED